MKKGLVYVLLIALLVVGVVYFTRSQDGVGTADMSATRLAGEEIALVDGVYQFDSEKSVLGWFGEKKLVPSSHSGTVNVKSGSLEVSEGVVVNGEVVVDMTSIALAEGDNGGNRLLNHLASNDFFAVEDYPEARLVVTSAEKTDTGYNVMADLTIRDKTNPVTFSMMPISGPADELVLTGELTFDRSLYGVEFGSESVFENLGDQIIKDEVVLNFALYLVENGSALVEEVDSSASVMDNVAETVDLVEVVDVVETVEESVPAE